MNPDRSGKEKQQFSQTIKNNIGESSFPFNLLSFLPHPLLQYTVNKLTDFAYQEKEIECQIKTVSQIIQEQKIKQIDLLKIDVEKAELDVLEGIEVQDWLKIKQIVIEVHNINDRVHLIVNLLRKHGFSQIEVAQDPVFTQFDIYSIYAKK